MNRLQDFLRRHRRIAVDTSIFIYQVEANDRYVVLADRIFSWIERPDRSAVTSSITMTELLVAPYRKSDEEQLNRYFGLLTTYPNLEWIAPDLDIADLAARLRAQHRMSTPDALQAATAATSQATGFVTNDSVFERVAAFETLLFDNLL